MVVGAVLVHPAGQQPVELAVAPLLVPSFSRYTEGWSSPFSPPRELSVAVSAQFALGWVVGHWVAGN